MYDGMIRTADTHGEGIHYIHTYIHTYPFTFTDIE